MVAHGIPESNIAQTRNPYRAEELLGSFDPNTTAVVFFVGAKDMKESPRFFNLDGTLKDGRPAYLKTLDLDNLQPMSAHGYVAVAPHESLEVPKYGEMSGSTIRDALKEGDEKVFEQIMGWFDENIYNMVKSKLSSLDETGAYSPDFEDLLNITNEAKKKVYMEPNMLQDPPQEDMIELDDDKLDEISASSAGSVEGAPAAQGGSFPGLDVAKENEEERKRSKGLKEQDSVVNEITNYLLTKKGYKV